MIIGRASPVDMNPSQFALLVAQLYTSYEFRERGEGERFLIRLLGLSSHQAIPDSIRLAIDSAQALATWYTQKSNGYSSTRCPDILLYFDLLPCEGFLSPIQDSLDAWLSSESHQAFNALLSSEGFARLMSHLELEAYGFSGSQLFVEISQEFNTSLSEALDRLSSYLESRDYSNSEISQVRNTLMFERSAGLMSHLEARGCSNSEISQVFNTLMYERFATLMPHLKSRGYSNTQLSDEISPAFRTAFSEGFNRLRSCIESRVFLNSQMFQLLNNLDSEILAGMIFHRESHNNIGTFNTLSASGALSTQGSHQQSHRYFVNLPSGERFRERTDNGSSDAPLTLSSQRILYLPRGRGGQLALHVHDESSDLESGMHSISIQSSAGQTRHNHSTWSETFLMITVQGGLALVTVTFTSTTSLTLSVRILMKFSGFCIATGFVGCLGGSLHNARTPRARVVARIMTGIGRIATIYGFLALMGTLLPDNLMLGVTGALCTVLLPSLTSALMN